MKVTPSLSGRGCCYDNASREHIFHILTVERIDPRRWIARDQARHDLVALLEGFDNQRHIQADIGYMTIKQAERNARQPPGREIGGKSQPSYII